MGAKFTRGRFLTALSAAATGLALTPTMGRTLLERTSKLRSSPIPKVWPLPSVLRSPPERVWAFRSRPDLSPGVVEVTRRAYDSAPGYILIALKEGAGEHGPMIIDDLGQLVWYGEHSSARDFKVQHYRGEPVLTWWEGEIVQAHGAGEYVIFDKSYREVARVQAGNGYRADLHELLITPQDTALLTVYEAAPMDLTQVGGPKDGAVWDAIAQELDIETGEVLFEWHCLEHVALEESCFPLPEDAEKFFDYVHINSIDIDHDENLLISARNTCAVYKVDRKSGEIIWRLGGKKSDFEVGPGTRFAFQHDARRQPDGTITIFDNGAYPRVHDQSRGIVVELDEEKMNSTLLREYTSPEKVLATSQGNMQVLPNANVFIGWGSEPLISEFSYDGALIFNAHFPPGGESYRAFRFPWSAHPTEEPAVAAEQRSDEKVVLYASWNGATEVATWEVLAGSDPGELESLGSVPRDGFETAMLVQTSDPYVAVRAKDRSSGVLGTTKPMKL
jgi:Arylsulfotransferase (ASST)